MSAWDYTVLGAIVIATFAFAVVVIGGVLLLAGRRADVLMERMDHDEGSPFHPEVQAEIERCREEGDRLLARNRAMRARRAKRAS